MTSTATNMTTVLTSSTTSVTASSTMSSSSSTVPVVTTPSVSSSSTAVQTSGVMSVAVTAGQSTSSNSVVTNSGATVTSRFITNDDQVEFFRSCRAIIDLGSGILRYILNRNVLPVDLPREVKKFQSSLPRLNTDENNLINSAPTTGYKDFDVTLLSTLIRNICPVRSVPPPSMGWKSNTMPPSTCTTLGDDVLRIRLLRNKGYGHVSDTAEAGRRAGVVLNEMTDICKRIDSLFGTSFSNDLSALQTAEMDSKAKRLHDAELNETKRKKEALEEEVENEKRSKKRIKGKKKKKKQKLLRMELLKRGETLMAAHLRQQLTRREKLEAECLQNIQDNNILIVTGKPGSGKSSLCAELIKQLVDMTEGRIEEEDEEIDDEEEMEERRESKIYVLYEPDDWLEVDIESESNIIVLIDNFCDEKQSESNTLVNWQQHLTCILDSARRKLIFVIFSVELAIFNYLSSLKSNNDIFDYFKPEKAYNLTGKWTLEYSEKLDIFKKQYEMKPKRSTVRLCENEINAIAQTKPSVGFFVACLSFFSSEENYEQGLKYFKDLEIDYDDIVQNIYQEKTAKFGILACILFRGSFTLNTIDPEQDTVMSMVSDFDSSSSRLTLRTHVEELERRCLIAVANESTSYKFVKDSAIIFPLLGVLSKHSTPILIRLSSADLVFDYIRSSRYKPKPGEVCLCIQPMYDSDLAEKLVSCFNLSLVQNDDEKEKCLSHPTCTDISFLKSLFRIFESIWTNTERLNNFKILLNWVCYKGRNHMAKECLDILSRLNLLTEDIFNRALKEISYCDNKCDRTVHAMSEYSHLCTIDGLLPIVRNSQSIGLRPKTLSIFLKNMTISDKDLVLLAKESLRRNMCNVVITELLLTFKSPCSSLLDLMSSCHRERIYLDDNALNLILRQAGSGNVYDEKKEFFQTLMEMYLEPQHSCEEFTTVVLMWSEYCGCGDLDTMQRIMFIEPMKKPWYNDYINDGRVVALLNQLSSDEFIGILEYARTFRENYFTTLCSKYNQKLSVSGLTSLLKFLFLSDESFSRFWYEVLHTKLFQVTLGKRETNLLVKSLNSIRFTRNMSQDAEKTTALIMLASMHQLPDQLLAVLPLSRHTSRYIEIFEVLLSIHDDLGMPSEHFELLFRTLTNQNQILRTYFLQYLTSALRLTTLNQHLGKCLAKYSYYSDDTELLKEVIQIENIESFDDAILLPLLCCCICDFRNGRRNIDFIVFFLYIDCDTIKDEVLHTFFTIFLDVRFKSNEALDDHDVSKVFSVVTRCKLNSGTLFCLLDRLVVSGMLSKVKTNDMEKLLAKTDLKSIPARNVYNILIFAVQFGLDNQILKYFLIYSDLAGLEYRKLLKVLREAISRKALGVMRALFRCDDFHKMTCDRRCGDTARNTMCTVVLMSLYDIDIEWYFQQPHMRSVFSTLSNQTSYLTLNDIISVIFETYTKIGKFEIELIFSFLVKYGSYHCKFIDSELDFLDFGDIVRKLTKTASLDSNVYRKFLTITHFEMPTFHHLLQSSLLDSQDVMYTFKSAITRKYYDVDESLYSSIFTTQNDYRLNLLQVMDLFLTVQRIITTGYEYDIEFHLQSVSDILSKSGVKEIPSDTSMKVVESFMIGDAPEAFVKVLNLFSTGKPYSCIVNEILNMLGGFEFHLFNNFMKMLCNHECCVDILINLLVKYHLGTASCVIDISEPTAELYILNALIYLKIRRHKCCHTSMSISAPICIDISSSDTRKVTVKNKECDIYSAEIEICDTNSNLKLTFHPVDASRLENWNNLQTNAFQAYLFSLIAFSRIQELSKRMLDFLALLNTEWSLSLSWALEGRTSGFSVQFQPLQLIYLYFLQETHNTNTPGLDDEIVCQLLQPARLWRANFVKTTTKRNVDVNNWGHECFRSLMKNFQIIQIDGECVRQFFRYLKFDNEKHDEEYNGIRLSQIQAILTFSSLLNVDILFDMLQLVDYNGFFLLLRILSSSRITPKMTAIQLAQVSLPVLSDQPCYSNDLKLLFMHDSQTAQFQEEFLCTLLKEIKTLDENQSRYLFSNITKLFYTDPDNTCVSDVAIIRAFSVFLFRCHSERYNIRLNVEIEGSNEFLLTRMIECLILRKLKYNDANGDLNWKTKIPDTSLEARLVTLKFEIESNASEVYLLSTVNVIVEKNEIEINTSVNDVQIEDDPIFFLKRDSCKPLAFAFFWNQNDSVTKSSQILTYIRRNDNHFSNHGFLFPFLSPAAIDNISHQILSNVIDTYKYSIRYMNSFDSICPHFSPCRLSEHLQLKLDSTVVLTDTVNVNYDTTWCRKCCALFNNILVSEDASGDCVLFFLRGLLRHRYVDIFENMMHRIPLHIMTDDSILSLVKAMISTEQIDIWRSFRHLFNSTVFSRFFVRNYTLLFLDYMNITRRICESIDPKMEPPNYISCQSQCTKVLQVDDFIILLKSIDKSDSQDKCRQAGVIVSSKSFKNLGRRQISRIIQELLDIKTHRSKDNCVNIDAHNSSIFVLLNEYLGLGKEAGFIEEEWSTINTIHIALQSTKEDIPQRLFIVQSSQHTISKAINISVEFDMTPSHCEDTAMISINIILLSVSNFINMLCYVLDNLPFQLHQNNIGHILKSLVVRQTRAISQKDIISEFDNTELDCAELKLVLDTKQCRQRVANMPQATFVDILKSAIVDFQDSGSVIKTLLRYHPNTPKLHNTSVEELMLHSVNTQCFRSDEYLGLFMDAAVEKCLSIEFFEKFVRASLQSKFDQSRTIAKLIAVTTNCYRILNDVLEDVIRSDTLGNSSTLECFSEFHQFIDSSTVFRAIVVNFINLFKDDMTKLTREICLSKNVKNDNSRITFVQLLHLFLKKNFQGQEFGTERAHTVIIFSTEFPRMYKQLRNILSNTIAMKICLEYEYRRINTVELHLSKEEFTDAINVQLKIQPVSQLPCEIIVKLMLEGVENEVSVNPLLLILMQTLTGDKLEDSHIKVLLSAIIKRKYEGRLEYLQALIDSQLYCSISGTTVTEILRVAFFSVRNNIQIVEILITTAIRCHVRLSQESMKALLHTLCECKHKRTNLYFRTIVQSSLAPSISEEVFLSVVSCCFDNNNYEFCQAVVECCPTVISENGRSQLENLKYGRSLTSNANNFDENNDETDDSEDEETIPDQSTDGNKHGSVFTKANFEKRAKIIDDILHQVNRSIV